MELHAEIMESMENYYCFPWVPWT